MMKTSQRFFSNLWHETLNELDAKTKDLVLHHIKLEIERRMEDKAQEISTFEQLRFQVKHRHDTVTLEGYCDKCKTEIQTSYPPDRPEIVYCEDCYKQEVY